MAVTMAMLIPDFAKREVSLPFLPFCSYPKQYLLYFSQAVVPSNIPQSSYLQATFPAFCGLWCLSGRLYVKGSPPHNGFVHFLLTPHQVLSSFLASVGPLQGSAQLNIDRMPAHSHSSSVPQISPWPVCVRKQIVASQV